MSSDDEYEELELENSDNNSSTLIKHRYSILLLFIGLIFSVIGIYLYKDSFFAEDEVEIIGDSTESVDQQAKIVAEIAGAVNNPGVFEMSSDSRVGDLIEKANGLSDTADVEWIARTINRAAKLNDGQKVFIPDVNQQSSDESDNSLRGGSDVLGDDNSSSQPLGMTQINTVNINTSTQSELEKLWGIGPVTAQNIIDQRPYSSVEELLNKKILKSNVYERNKDLLTVY